MSSKHRFGLYKSAAAPRLAANHSQDHNHPWSQPGRWLADWPVSDVPTVGNLSPSRNFPSFPKYIYLGIFHYNSSNLFSCNVAQLKHTKGLLMTGQHSPSRSNAPPCRLSNTGKRKVYKANQIGRSIPFYSGAVPNSSYPWEAGDGGECSPACG